MQTASGGAVQVLYLPASLSARDKALVERADEGGAPEPVLVGDSVLPRMLAMEKGCISLSIACLCFSDIFKEGPVSLCS